MKTRFLIVVVLISLFSKVYCQDTSKIQIVFQTKLNQPVTLYKEVYLGDINTVGYSGSHFVHQQGTLTKNELLFNAPNTGYFEKNKPVVLLMTDDYSYAKKFTVESGFENQKWLLTPAGKNYSKSKALVSLGVIGVISSAIIFTFVILHNNHLTRVYEMDMDHYNWAKTHNMLDYVSAPQKPKLTPYTIPIVTLSFSISSFIIGRIINLKNRPLAERIE
jgi:hypothetical protein